MPLKRTFFAFLLLLLALLFNLEEARAYETYDGRPPEAFPSTSPTPVSSTTETCTCTSSDGSYTHTCTVSRPPEMRPCLEVCVEEADMMVNSSSTTLSTPSD